MYCLFNVDQITINVSVPSRSLYTYIIGHCADYNLQRIDTIQASGDGCGSSIAWDNCLVIDLRTAVIGLTTTPELSQVIKETKDLYNVMVLALPEVNKGEEPVSTEIPLIIYMLLVNKLELYPRLTADSPLISSYRRLSAMGNDGGGVGGGGVGGSDHERQSRFHDSVRLHRRKLGYGSLGSPSSASEMVFNPHILRELMSGLKVSMCCMLL